MITNIGFYPRARFFLQFFLRAEYPLYLLLAQQNKTNPKCWFSIIASFWFSVSLHQVITQKSSQ